MGNRFWIVLLCVALVAVFYALGVGDVREDNEGQRAAPPATMLRTGDYIIPRLNGEPYLVKPPLLYWAIAGVYSVAGVSEFTARVPTALCGAALVVSMYLFARKAAGERAARWGALALLASPYAFQRMRFAELDIPLTLATFLAILFARNATLSDPVQQRIRFCILSGVSFGAAVMLKGPVPFLFFGAGLVATLVASSPQLGRVMNIGIKVSVAAFGLEVLLKVLASRVLPAYANLVSAPIALVVVMLVWAFLALRYSGLPLSVIGIWLGAMLIGVLLALPWGLAVLHTMGWDSIRAMLNNQVVERTYVASEINSGAPWYFLVMIGPMLAPWGFLLPLQFSKREWERQSDMYRFCVLVSWLSVLVFSLIAGKEYEYILPCIPFMAIALGHHVAQIDTGLLSPWMERWCKYWQIGALVLLIVALLGGVVYVAVEHFSVGLFALILPLAALGLAACLISLRSHTYRSAGVFIASLCAILLFLISRGDENTGDESPKRIAIRAAQYVNAGYTVESSKVYPAFDFYAQTVIPLEQSPARVQEKFAGEKPYIYLTRQSLIKVAGIKSYEVLAGPIEFKELMLVANRKLPEPTSP
ncbi:MAG: glycosyltransferase family 39 protein [Candidatus Hydrogenedentes bacterium]|nr:glycosyltransferase family 39 protein [Candidatus Hydrogenedentota bacterium]